eukprot:scaffold91_cov254-Pinguiococcus_pyrenoidosus.AAC.18
MGLLQRRCIEYQIAASNPTQTSPSLRQGTETPIRHRHRALDAGSFPLRRHRPPPDTRSRLPARIRRRAFLLRSSSSPTLDRQRQPPLQNPPPRSLCHEPASRGTFAERPAQEAPVPSHAGLLPSSARRPASVALPRRRQLPCQLQYPPHHPALRARAPWGSSRCDLSGADSARTLSWASASALASLLGLRPAPRSASPCAYQAREAPAVRTRHQGAASGVRGAASRQGSPDWVSLFAPEASPPPLFPPLHALCRRPTTQSHP